MSRATFRLAHDNMTMSQKTAKHLVPVPTVNPPMSQQSQGTVQVQPLQPTPLPHIENCQESKVVYIVVEVPEQNIQRQKNKTAAEGGCIVTPKPGHPKPKVRVMARRGRTAATSAAQRSEISSCSASKENVEKAQIRANRHAPTMGSAKGKACLGSSTECVLVQGRGWMVKQRVEGDSGPDSTRLAVTEENISLTEVFNVDGLNGKKQDEGVAVTVSTPKSTLTNLLTSPDLDLLAPMATSTPLSRNLKKRSPVETESHLPKTAKVSLQFKVNPSSLEESGVPTSWTIPVTSSNSLPEKPALTESPLVAAHHSDLVTFSPLFSTSTLLSQTSSASIIHHSKNQLAGETLQVQTPTASHSQVLTFSRTSTEKRKDTVKGHTQDSGIGMSVLSQVLTSASTEAEVSMVCHGASGFSTLEASEDSNQKLVVKNLSDGSLDEESSNSQGGDGELNTSLTKMHWLKDYALKKKVMGSEHLLFPEGPVNRRLEARQKKDMCSCGILREAIAKKPGYTYKHMIQMSMVSKKNKPMMAQEIRTYFAKNWTFFKSHQTCLFWQNAIRHNLSSNDCFLKCPDRKGYWYLDPDEYQELKLKEASLLNANQGHIPQVLDPVLVGQSTQPIVLSSAFPATAQVSGPSSFGSTGVLRRTGYAPILPRQVLNISNQSPALIQQNSPVYIHYPAISVQPAPFPAITMSSTLPKRPLPPLPSTASRMSASSCKKTKPVRGKNRGKASSSSKDSKMKKTKSTGDVGVHGDLIARAAMESGLLDGNLCSKNDISGVSFPSLCNSSGMNSNNPGEAGPQKHTAADSSTGCLVLARSASMPPILSKRRKVLPLTTTPIVHNVCVSPQRRTCSNPPHHQQQHRRGRRKQNLLLSSIKDTELIITGSESGTGKEVTPEAEQPDLPATDSSGDNVVDTSLSLTGLEAAQFQVSSLMSPTPRDSPEPPPIPLKSPTSALAPVAGKQKGEVEPLQSPISSGISLAVESVHADDSGLMMVDFAQCGIDSGNKKLVVSPNKSSISFDLSVLNTPPSKSWPLKSPTTPGDFNFDFVNFVFKRGQLSGDIDQQGMCSTTTTQPNSQQGGIADQSSCSWHPTFQSSTVNKTPVQERSKTAHLVGNQQLNGLRHQQEENDWLSEYLGTLPATTSGPSQMLNTPQTSLTQHVDHLMHTSEWHLPSSQFTYQSQEAQHSQMNQFSPQTQVFNQKYVPSPQSGWRPSSAPASTQQSSSNQDFSALHHDTSLLQLPPQQNSVHEVHENSALRGSSLCFQPQFTGGTAPMLPSSQVTLDCHGAMSFSDNVASELSISNFDPFSFTRPVQISGNSNASRENNIASSSYGNVHDVACSSSVSDKKPYMQFETTNSDSKPTIEPNHLNISLDISCFDDLQTSLQNNSFPSQCASNGSPTLQSAEVPSFHSTELPSFHSIGSPTFHGAGSPSFHDTGSPGFHSAVSSSFHSSMLPSFQKGSYSAESLQKQKSIVTDSTELGTRLGYNFACDNSPLSSLCNQEGGASMYGAFDQMSNTKLNQNVDLHQQPRNNAQQQQQNCMHSLQS